jgi:hypothetical protein
MKIANHEISTNPKKREIVSAALGKDYDGTVRVRHFVEIIIEDIGLDAFKKALTHTLGGLKVAPYYGCLMVRPPEVAGLDDPENPVYLDRLINAMGGVGLDWPHKVECCGGSLTLTRSDLVVKLSESIIAMAKVRGRVFGRCLSHVPDQPGYAAGRYLQGHGPSIRHADHLYFTAHRILSRHVGGCPRIKQTDRFAQSSDGSCSVFGKVINHGKR